MRFIAPIFLLLAACGDWPDAGGPPIARDTRPWPVLLPIEQIGGAPLTLGREDAERLAARASALRARAAILRQNATTREEMEALRARLPR